MKKIINRLVILTLVLCAILSIGSAETIFVNDSLEYGTTAYNYHNGIGDGAGGWDTYTFTDSVSNFNLRYAGQSQSGTPQAIHYEKVKLINRIDFDDIPQNTGGSFSIYSGTTFKGTGTLMIRKGISDGLYDIDIDFDPNTAGLEAGVYDVKLYSSIIYNYFRQVEYGFSGWLVDGVYNDLNIAFGPYTGATQNPTFIHSSTGSQYITYEYEAQFRNDYSLKFFYSMAESTINRNVGDGNKESTFILKDSLGDTMYNSGSAIINETYYHDNGTYNYYIYSECDSTLHLIYSNLVIPDEVTDATLTFNQSTYNISTTYEDNEIIRFDYTNLDDLEETNETYSLQYYKYIDNDNIEYVYKVPLSGSLDEYADTGYTNPYGWTPCKMYYGIINDNIDLNSKMNFLANAKLKGYFNVTYPYEFILDSNTGSGVQYNNGDTIVITYNCNDEYPVFINDSAGDIIQVLDSVLGFGTIEYTIPFDDNKQYEYPSWEMGLNVSSDEFMVYWIEESEYIEYVDDITYDEQETVEENIDELRESIQPIKDLVIGFGSVIIENPDYDNNGIVEGPEMDQWFNGIIGLLLVIVIYVFYKGLSQR